MKPIPYEPMPAVWQYWVTQYLRDRRDERNLADTLGATFFNHDPLSTVTVDDWDAVTIDTGEQL